MKYDCLVIGAGMSGLCAGIRLSHFGKKVLVLDKHTRAGGLNSWYEMNGYRLDTGLHAMTNYDINEPKNAPLNKVLRLLRLDRSIFDLVPGNHCEIRFPDHKLIFDNNRDTITQSVADLFPSQIDAFAKLLKFVAGYEDIAKDESARALMASLGIDHALAEMIICPLMYYGSATPGDMPLWQFVIMFRSLYLEGICRPRNGIGGLLDPLLEKLEKNGGELRLGEGVKNIITHDGKFRAVLTDKGNTIEAAQIISSAGGPETEQMCEELARTDGGRRPGEMAFSESINILKKPAEDYGEKASLIFYNLHAAFEYLPAKEPFDTNSGVICFPGNFEFGDNKPAKIDALRITHMADYDYWDSLAPFDYAKAKAKWHKKSVETVLKIVPGLPSDFMFFDVFTPTTVRRFTGRARGAIYGSPDKTKSGLTGVKNLYLCGTDQGYLGVTGSMLSGILIANVAMQN